MTLRIIGVTMAAAIMTGACASAPVARPTAPWITQEEAALPDAPESRAPEELPKNGPAIRIVSPTEAAVTKPFDIDVRFEPRPGGAPVDPASLKVAVIKFFEWDITDKVRPYVVGSRLYYQGAEIPAGRHRIRISIADRDGGLTADILQLTVK
jgi:hypothetical protein